MPIYEYENPEHGITVALRMPVNERKNEIILKRKQIPSHLTVGVGAKPPTMGEKLHQGYKVLEECGQLKETGGNYLPLDTVKKVLAAPDTD